MISAAPINLVQVAYYMPRNSAFAELVGRIYQIDDIHSHFATSALFSRSRNSINELNRPPVMGMRIDHKALEEHKKIEDLKEALSDSDIQEIIDEFSESIPKSSTPQTPIIAIINNSIIKFTTKKESLNKESSIKTILNGIIMTLVSAIVISLASAKDQPDTSRYDNVYMVATESGELNVRGSPNETHSQVIGKLQKGTLVVVLNEANDFYEIDCEASGLSTLKGSCFVSRRYLQPVFPNHKAQ